MKYDLRKVWCKETAHPTYQKIWSSGNPSAGQCCVTALLMQAVHGGSIVECFANGRRHYVNVILGEFVDFTGSQFSAPIVYQKMRTRTRESLLKCADVAYRYNILCKRFYDVYGIMPKMHYQLIKCNKTSRLRCKEDYEPTAKVQLGVIKCNNVL